jgi:hypothetical protein
LLRRQRIANELIDQRFKEIEALCKQIEALRAEVKYLSRFRTAAKLIPGATAVVRSLRSLRASARNPNSS